MLQWDFGTLAMDSRNPTGCVAKGLPEFQMVFPTSEIFWDPPIPGAVPVPGAYVAAIPPALKLPIAATVSIDLYFIQQHVLHKQDRL